jgi:ankyrin repeat protein
MMMETNSDEQCHVRWIRPVELPEMVRMILSNLGFKDRLRAQQVNTIWCAQTPFSSIEYNCKLFMAIRRNNPEIALKLLSKKRGEPALGGTLFHLSCKQGLVDVVHALLTHPGMNVLKSALTGLRIASKNGHVGVVKALLAAEPRIDLSGPPCTNPFWAICSGLDVLNLASNEGHVNIVTALLADDRITGVDYAGLIRRARRNRHAELTQYLLAKNITDGWKVDVDCRRDIVDYTLDDIEYKLKHTTMIKNLLNGTIFL